MDFSQLLEMPDEMCQMPPSAFQGDTLATTPPTPPHMESPKLPPKGTYLKMMDSQMPPPLPKPWKKPPIKTKIGFKSNAEKLYEEIEKAKLKEPLPKRPPTGAPQKRPKEEEKKEEEPPEKKIPELIFLQPLFHVYIQV